MHIIITSVTIRIPVRKMCSHPYFVLMRGIPLLNICICIERVGALKCNVICKNICTCACVLRTLYLPFQNTFFLSCYERIYLPTIFYSALIVPICFGYVIHYEEPRINLHETLQPNVCDTVECQTSGNTKCPSESTM